MAERQPKRVKMAARDMPDAKCKILVPDRNLNPGDIITLPKEQVRRLVNRGRAEYIEDMPAYAVRIAMARRGEVWETVRSMTVPVTKGGRQARRREVEPPDAAAAGEEDASDEEED